MSEMITTTEAKLMSHEAVCAERYKGIADLLDKGSQRMTKIEYLLYAVMAVVLLGPGVGAEFFKKLLGI
jgi:predicted nucleic acid-binding Zn ribbon protein